MKWLVLFASMLFLMGAKCSRSDLPEPAVACPIATEVRVQTQNIYVPLPDRVTRPVTDSSPRSSKTFGQAVTDADRRSLLLKQCNAQLKEAATLQNTPVPN